VNPLLIKIQALCLGKFPEEVAFKNIVQILLPDFESLFTESSYLLFKILPMAPLPSVDLVKDLLKEGSFLGVGYISSQNKVPDKSPLNGWLQFLPSEIPYSLS
jgi:hypothetical protein